MGDREQTKTYSEALWDLEQRMRRLEAIVGVSETAPAPRRVPPHLSRVNPMPEPASVVPAAPAVVPPPLPVQYQRVEAPRPVIPTYQPPASVEPVPQTALEQTIGLKWAGWIGAVVVVIGAGLGIKFAYEQGWFEILPPAGRLALMSLAGFALIGAGEVVFRRIHQIAAACLFGAGVATLFLVSYAGHGYYRLYNPETAFVLMGLTTIIGAAVAVRGNLLSIAVLAQIGGNLAPVLLRSDQPHLVPFLTYVLTLQVVALALAWWGGMGRWWGLRVLSLATTTLWVAALVLNHRVVGVTSLMTFSLLCAALYQVELLLSAARPRVPVADAAAEEPLSMSLAASSPTALAVAFSIGVTALLTAAVLGILHGSSDATRGGWVIALSAVCAVLGFVLSGKTSVTHPLYKIAVGFRIQAAALLVVAVPVALSGVWILFGWAALALAFTVAGTVMNLPISRWAGVMVWRLALGYLGWWSLSPILGNLGRSIVPTGAHAVWLQLLGHDVRAYTVLAWMLAIVGHVIAWLIHPEGLGAPEEEDGRFPRLARITQVLATVTWFTASIAGLAPAGATLAILLYAWLLLGADLLNARLGLVLQSAVVVVLVTLKWIAIDTLAERLAPGWSPMARRPVFNAVMGVGLLISLTMSALYWLRREALWEALTRRPTPSDAYPARSPAAPALALAAAIMAIFAVGLTVEIDRMVEAAGAAATLWPLWQLKSMAWTVLWMLCACAYLALSRKLEPDDALRPGWVRAAEVLAVLVAFKFLVVDTLLFRAFSGATRSAPLFNFQTLTAVVVAGGMILVAYLMTRGSAGGDGAIARPRGIVALAGFLAILVVLWGGTLEIDRAFERMIAAGGSGTFADPRRAKQVAFSIFWSIFAVSCVLSGFRFRTAGLRYFGLGLFAVTLLKVVLIDMSQVQTGYRVLSFLGLGLLLMGTSVLYGKLSPLLLRNNDDGPPASHEHPRAAA